MPQNIHKLKHFLLAALLSAPLNACGWADLPAAASPPSSSADAAHSQSVLPSATGTQASPASTTPVQPTTTPIPTAAATPTSTALTSEAAQQTVRALLMAFGQGDYSALLTNKLRSELGTFRTADEALGLHNLPLAAYEVREPLDPPSEAWFVPARLQYQEFVEERIYEVVVEKGQWRISGSTLAAAAPSEGSATARLPSAPISADSRLALSKALLAHLKTAPTSKPTVVAAIALDGDYAAAIAQPQGQKTIYAFLKHTATGWDVIEATSIPSGEVLRQKGVPDSVTEANDTYAVVDAFIAQLQDPHGPGAAGIVVVESIVQNFARVVFIPNELSEQDPFTAFLKREGDSWTQIVGGTAFEQATLEALGIPGELWSQP